MVTVYHAVLRYNFSRGHHLPCKIYCLVLACIKVITHIRPLNFCHDIAKVLQNSYASFQIFPNNKI
jgi:hypothetical protein